MPKTSVDDSIVGGGETGESSWETPAAASADSNVVVDTTEDPVQDTSSAPQDSAAGWPSEGNGNGTGAGW